MTKAELIEGLSQRTSLNLKESNNVVNAFFDSITEGLAKGEKVNLRGFGTFRVSERKARTARNPKTRAIVQVRPKKCPLFKAGKELKRWVNN